jgi:hypothetical protein
MIAAAAGSALSWDHALAVIGILTGAILIAGAGVIIARRQLGPSAGEPTVIRSFLAIALVFGLLIFTVVAMTLTDTTVRSVLIGAAAANAGAAIAFYFASKASDQTREDVFRATFGSETVPDLVGLTQDEAERTLGKTSLRLQLSPRSPSGATVVDAQDPPRNVVVRGGSAVTVMLKSGDERPAQHDGKVPVQRIT